MSGQNRAGVVRCGKWELIEHIKTFYDGLLKLGIKNSVKTGEKYRESQITIKTSQDFSICRSFKNIHLYVNV